MPEGQSAGNLTVIGLTRNCLLRGPLRLPVLGAHCATLTSGAFGARSEHFFLKAGPLFDRVPITAGSSASPLRPGIAEHRAIYDSCLWEKALSRNIEMPETPKSTASINVFVSYSHRDEELKSELLKHLLV
jgi:hypothetical protein